MLMKLVLDCLAAGLLHGTAVPGPRHTGHHYLESTVLWQRAKLWWTRAFALKSSLWTFHTLIPFISLAKASHLAKPNFNAMESMIPSQGGISSSTDNNIIMVIIFIKNFYTPGTMLGASK